MPDNLSSPWGVTSRRLRLRFVTRAELPVLRERFSYEQGGFNDFGQVRGGGDPHPGGPPEAPVRDDHNGVLFIERQADGVAIGTIQYFQTGFGPNAESAGWMIGLELLPEHRGHGYGSEAQRALADWLFENTAANRVEAQTDADNVAEARSLEKAGFTREGLLRGAQFRAGAYHDLLVYSRLRDDE